MNRSETRISRAKAHTMTADQIKGGHRYLESSGRIRRVNEVIECKKTGDADVVWQPVSGFGKHCPGGTISMSQLLKRVIKDVTAPGCGALCLERGEV